MCVSPCDWLYMCVWLSVCLCASAIRRGGEWSKDISAGGRAFRIIFSVNKGEMKNITLLLCQCFLFHMNTPRPIATWPHRSYKSQQGRRGRLQSWMASVENREIQREVNNCLVLSVRCGVSRPGEMTIRSGVCGLAWQRLHVVQRGVSIYSRYQQTNKQTKIPLGACSPVDSYICYGCSDFCP